MARFGRVDRHPALVTAPHDVYARECVYFDVAVVLEKPVSAEQLIEAIRAAQEPTDRGPVKREGRP
jgi:hypothetical protein